MSYFITTKRLAGTKYLQHMYNSSATYSVVSSRDDLIGQDWKVSSCWDLQDTGYMWVERHEHTA